MNTFLILLIMYLISAFAVWIHVHLSYSLEGVNAGWNPSIVHFLAVLIPFVNTACALIMWYQEHPRSGLPFPKYLKISKGSWKVPNMSYNLFFAVGKRL